MSDSYTSLKGVNEPEVQDIHVGLAQVTKMRDSWKSGRSESHTLLVRKCNFAMFYAFFLLFG